MLHQINPHDVDSVLLQIDRLLFGHLSGCSSLCPLPHTTWPTFPAPHPPGGRLVGGRKRGAFNRFVLGVHERLLSLLSRIYPAVRLLALVLHAGPILPLPSRNSHYHFIRGFVASAESLQWDCFPSGHRSPSLLSSGTPSGKVAEDFYLPIDLFLSLSTVYCRYHYVMISSPEFPPGHLRPLSGLGGGTEVSPD